MVPRISIAVAVAVLLALGFAAPAHAALGTETLNAGGDVVDRALVAIPFLVILALVARSLLPQDEE